MGATGNPAVKPEREPDTDVTEHLPFSVARHLVAHTVEVSSVPVALCSDGSQVVKITALAGQPSIELTARFNVGPLDEGLPDAVRAMQLAAWALSNYQVSNVQ